MKILLWLSLIISCLALLFSLGSYQLPFVGGLLTPPGGGLLSPGGGFQRQATTTSLINLGDYLGIGTATPQTTLEVVNTSVGISTSPLFLSNLSSATSTASRLTFRANDVLNGTSTAAITGILTQNFSTGKGNLIFSTLRSGLLTESMRILDNGNVGIGTTSPARILSVSSSGTTTVYIDSISGTQGTCLKMKNATGTDYTFITAAYGSLVISTVSCE